MATVENPYEKVRSKMVAARLEFLSQLAAFSNNEIAREPGENEWSPLQLANHLYVADGLALEQMQIVQNEDNPLVMDVGEEAPRRTHASEIPVSVEAVLAGMAARREELYQYMANLPVDAWERPFRHPAWGQLKFYQLVNVLPAHDRTHAQQLTAIKAKYSQEQSSRF
ncbi:MAG TPA: DinB family protein [Ktedonobacteraceae bacterium]|nr:DinB family protein [Ktedonobacteraceae bacterium]